jgi:2,3-bisphosphoglycerate-dependent phosphoglycerate mutase
MEPLFFKPATAARPLVFMRHGATQANLEGLRCGGDIDLPVSDIGREQVEHAAIDLRASKLRIDVIVASDLLRVRESALIVSRHLGYPPIVVEPGFRERSLGEWNLQPASRTEQALRDGVTPPGGESKEDFKSRIERALGTLTKAPAGQRQLLVASRGVARVLGELLGEPQRQGAKRGNLTEHGAANAEWMIFDLAHACSRVADRSERVAT